VLRRGRWLELCWYVALSAIVLAVNLARGAEFYVAPAGSDSNVGSAAAPWQSLQHAADVVAAGDRVIVRSGSYTGFYLDASGSPGSPIEFFAEPGAQITTQNGVTPDGINLEAASHVIIDGFTVAGMPRTGVRTVGSSSDFAEFVTIRNVHTANNGKWGILTGHVDDLLIENNETSGSMDEHGIYVSNSGDRPVIRNNVSWGNRGNGIHMNGDRSLGGDGVITGALVSGNRIFDNGLGGGSGINMDGVQDSRIENNLIYQSHASGVSLYQIDGGGPSSGNVVVNNTIHQDSDGRWAINIQNGSVNNTLLNNILVTQYSFRGAIDVSASSLPGLVSDYNAVVSRFTTDGADTILSLAQWQAATGQDAHSLVATPAELFENWSAGDYRLRPNSPAIDKGTSMLAPPVDLFGAPRPASAVDIGAIEFRDAPNLAADFTGDGRVDGGDLAAWRSAFGPSALGDADEDNDSDGADFLLWQRQLNVTTAAPVPEPATKLMWALSVLYSRLILGRSHAPSE